MEAGKSTIGRTGQQAGDSSLATERKSKRIVAWLGWAGQPVSSPSPAGWAVTVPPPPACYNYTITLIFTKVLVEIVMTTR